MALNKNTIIITIISLIFIVGFLSLVYVTTSTPQKVEVVESAKTVQATDHIKWSPEKKQILVEYSDLQCPACKAYHDAIKAQIETSGIPKKITFVYRHFPLDQIHPNARGAAHAAEAAGKQNKFFEYADLLFAKQEEWGKEKNPREYFMNLAKELKLNEEQFAKDLDSQEVRQKVANDANLAVAARVNATPTFFLNGVKVDVRSFDEFKTLLEKTGQTPAK